MTWDHEQREYDRLDDQFAFDVRCGECGAEYDNRDDGCPACGNVGSMSYDSADAARWNEHARRMGYA